MPRIKLLLCLIGMTAVAGSAYSQLDSLSKKTDSVNVSILKNFNEKILQIQRQHQDDSIQKTVLESQINSLKSNDNLKREALQKELEDLNNRETFQLTQKKIRIDSLRKIAPGYPVNGFFDDTLFYIYNKLGSFSPKERADAISLRLQSLVKDRHFKPDSLKIANTETTVD
ncbi:MAG: hypothetical protein ABIR19_10405, partial [Ginsengibacter sp.]